MRRRVSVSLFALLMVLAFLNIRRKNGISVPDEEPEIVKKSYLPWTEPIPHLNYQKVFLYGAEMDMTLLRHMEPVEFMEESKEAKERNEKLMNYHKLMERSARKERRMPDIIHAGVKKCGTGWTKHILGWHPAIKTISHPVELREFSKSGRLYTDDLPEVNEHQLLMEGDMNYLKRRRFGNAHSIYGLIPNAKVWITVCEPSRRIFSDFTHMMLGKNFKIMNVTNVHDQDLGEMFDKFVDSYLPRAENLYSGFCSGEDLEGKREKEPELWIFRLSMYYSRILSYLKEYARDKFYVINGEEMFKNPGRGVEKLQEFLGIPKFIIADDFVQNPETGLYCLRPTVYHDSRLYKLPTQCVEGGGKGRTRSQSTNKKPSENAIRKLKTFYKCFDERLYKFLGKKFW